ncbi:MAG TPA: hypothetical protein VFU47_09095 [Armatimonadota bacterium]|nr:hypothetical protein [Armatimonadota bacterium]
MRAKTRALAGSHVRRARDYWRAARTARRSGWPDVAVGLENAARIELRVARFILTERRKAGVY